MEVQQQTDYCRIEAAINFINNNFKAQPNLQQIADHIHVSAAHFQRLFTDWAGVSPKKFLQYITIAHAKKLLKNGQATLFEAAFESGLSGTGRLHDLFINIEGMTPGEYKNGGENLRINYDFAETPFGKIIVAATTKGICHIAFADDETIAFSVLQSNFPNAVYRQKADITQQHVLAIFNHNLQHTNAINLHVKGTPFQLKVWETLLKIPAGNLTTYGTISKHIALPGASRAVGTAIGCNPVAFIIPCHRVIQATGVFGGYHWGSVRKTVIIGWEAAHTQTAEAV